MAQELASILMPQVLRPVPAATMILFEPKASLHEKATIAAGTELASRPIESVSCKFVTTMSLEIEPVALRMAQWQTETDGQRFLRLELSSDLPPGSDAPDRLRFFLADEFERATNLLMLLQYYGGHAQAVDLRTNRPFGELEMTFPGFDEPLVPQPENGMPGFGMLRELLFFPEKFLYVEFSGLSKCFDSQAGLIAIDVPLHKCPHPLPELSSRSFLLNVVPAVNLFRQSAEPINVTHEDPDYLVLPDGLARQHHQIFSIDSVIGLQSGMPKPQPYASFSWTEFGASGHEPSYRVSNRPAMNGDWVETFIAMAYHPDEVPKPQTLSIELTCTNRWLPERLKLGDVCEPTNSSPERCHFSNITAVKGAVDVPIGEGLLWACIGHTAINLMSLGSADTTHSVLRLYNSFRIGDHAVRVANERQIDGIRGVHIEPQNRVHSGTVIRGQAIHMACDQSHWPCVGAMYLWGGVLARFFATHASINMYTQFHMTDRNTGVEFQWPAMLGTKPLI